MVLQDACCKRNRIVRSNAAIRLEFERQFVVIGTVANARVFDFVRHFLDRREQCIHRDEADRRIARTVLRRRYVAFAYFHDQFHVDARAFIQRADHKVLVQHFHIRIGLYHASGDFTRFRRLQHHAFTIRAVGFQFQVLDIEDDVHHVLTHARDGREFVLHAFDFDAGDSSALQRAEQDAAHGHAEGDAEAALERLSNNDRFARVAGDGFHIEFARFNQVFPVLVQ